MVDGINNIASQIFSKLNSQDSNGTDDKIEASIWNKFVSDKGGKEISNYIKKENAVKSIISYLTNMSKKVGCTVEELANQWLGKSEANPSEISGEKSKLNSKSVDVPYIAISFGDVQGYDEDKKENAYRDMNEATQFVSDIANGKYKYTVSSKTFNNMDKEMSITLKDGRSIKVNLAKNSEGKYKLFDLHIGFGETNYNGNQKSIGFEGSDGNERLCYGNEWLGIASEKDFQELVKVISGILGEDIET